MHIIERILNNCNDTSNNAFIILQEGISKFGI